MTIEELEELESKTPAKPRVEDCCKVQPYPHTMGYLGGHLVHVDTPHGLIDMIETEDGTFWPLEGWE